MDKKIVFPGLFILASLTSFSQSSNDFLFGAAFDIVKTDNDQIFEKAQLGVEGHYFIIRHFAIGLGAELWTSPQESSFMMGMRWYPVDNFFVRFRGLIGANEATAGVGWAKAINERFRVELMGDFYFRSTEFAVRAGVSYVIKKK